MLQYILAPIQPSQSSLVRGNPRLPRVLLGVQIAVAGEDPGLPQKQEHFRKQVSADIPPCFSGENSHQSKRRDGLNQKCLFCSNGSRVSKATAASESAANVRAETMKAWTFLTRLSVLRQMHHEGRHQPAQHPEVDRSCTEWLKDLVSILSDASLGKRRYLVKSLSDPQALLRT